MSHKFEGAVVTGKYRNLFEEAGYSKEAIDARLEEIFQTLFYGSEEERIYHPAGDDMGYMEDTGNHDVRTEGMSYGMMMCVQLDRKEEFDRLWKWAMTYMYIDYGWSCGYFAWSCRTDGTKNSEGPAPDGEEYFAMALLFAEKRWGNGEGIYNYGAYARKILSDCLHKGERLTGMPMWNPENYMIYFIVGCDYTDPSYHLPHFYELYAKWGNEEDRTFWERAAAASRDYWQKACHPETGMSAEYAEFDGSPKILQGEELVQFGGRHDWYYSDAYRTIANIALDYQWFGGDYGYAEGTDGEQSCFPVRITEKLQKFFCETRKENEHGIFLIDGTPVEGKALHPVAMIAVNAQASLASEGPYAMDCVKRFFETPLRTGDRRYYDNCLYLFAFLALSGNYRMSW